MKNQIIFLYPEYDKDTGLYKIVFQSINEERLALFPASTHKPSDNAWSIYNSNDDVKFIIDFADNQQ